MLSCFLMTTVVGQPLSEVTAECSWATHEFLQSLRKVPLRLPFPKKNGTSTDRELASLPVKGKNYSVGDRNQCFNITETIIHKERILHFGVSLKRQKALKQSFPHWCLQPSARALNVSRTAPLFLARKDSLCDDYKWKDWIIHAAEKVPRLGKIPPMSCCCFPHHHRGYLIPRWAPGQAVHRDSAGTGRRRGVNTNTAQWGLEAARDKPLQWWSYHSLALSWL